MANELTFLDTVNKVSGVCNNLTTFIMKYKETKVADRAKMQSILDEIEATRSLQRSKAIGAIGQSNLSQIKEYMKSMDGLPTSGPIYDAAMKNLEIMTNALYKVLEDFTK